VLSEGGGDVEAHSAVIDPVLSRAFAGGLLIGGGAAALLLLNGRVAGVSGVVDRLVQGAAGERAWRIAFLAGLILPAALLGPWTVAMPRAWWLVIGSGLLVGFGTRLGSGCTSGHGVCGIANFSRRSLIATIIFMATALITVWLSRHGGLA
jgi:uncharacterized membrane protein YedE/YeeE